MSQPIEITTLEDPRLDVFARLTDTALRSKAEPEKGVFIAESAKVIALALDAGCRPLAFLAERRRLAGAAAPLLARCPEVPVFTGERSVLAQLTGYALTRGVLCAMERPAPLSPEAVWGPAARLAILEGVVDATNVGAIFRSAAALGMDGVLLSHTCCHPLTRRAVRVSMGTVFQVPWAVLAPGQWPGPALEALRAAGFVSAALALQGDTVALDDSRLAGAPRLALVLGAEGDGLAAATAAACDYTVRIPMARGVDSLNVAAAGAVAFWQVRRREGEIP